MSLLGATQNPSVASLTDTTLNRTSCRRSVPRRIKRRVADRYHAKSNIVSLTGTALNLNDGVYRPVASLTDTTPNPNIVSLLGTTQNPSVAPLTDTTLNPECCVANRHRAKSERRRLQAGRVADRYRT